MPSARPEAPQKGTVFVSDPSAEAERVAQALRAAGYTVVDVPLSILVARVAVQRPRVVVVDADGEGALETVARMRELADSESIDILFMGRLGAAFQVPEEALVHEGSGFFARPVDAEAVVRKVNALMQVRASGIPAAAAAEQAALDASWKEPEKEKDRDRSRDLGKKDGDKLGDKDKDGERDKEKALAAPRGSVPPLAQVSNDPRKNASSKPPIHEGAASTEKKGESHAGAAAEASSVTTDARGASPPMADEPSSAPPSSQKLSSKPPASLPSPGIRESPSAPPPSMARASRVPSQPPPPSMPAIMRARKGAQGPLSEELMQLLAEAEERLGGEAVGYDLPSLSPEEEIDAVLPEEILAALDDPLEEEDEEEPNDSALGSQGRVTTSGGSKQTTGASRRHTTGVADAGTGSVAQPRSEVSAPTALVASTAPFGVRVPLSPTVAPHPPHPSSAISSPTTQGDSALRGFRPPSESPPPLFSQTTSSSQATSDPDTSPRPVEARHPSSRPPSTAMAPTAAGFTLGSDALMPVALALEAAQEARREAAPQSPPYSPQIPPMSTPRDAPPHLVPSSSVASSQNIVPSSTTTEIPAVLGPHDAPRAIARAIATRTTGTLCLESKEGVRRVVLREGDLVTAASGVDDESLIAFLVAHGDLPRESLQALAGRFATFGRHAGAALVAQGYLRQDQLWPVLRAHAEWILGRALAIDSGTALMEPDAPGRLKAEPSVFGGSTGAEVFVDVVRRVISQDDAFARLGGAQARIGEGRNANLLTECALGAPEIAVLEQLRGLTLAQATASAPDTDMIAVLYGLHLLGVIEVLRSVGAVPPSRDRSSEPRLDTLDDDAIRARIRARLDLVEEGDYFAVLGVPRTATSYEVRRAFTELRRAFDPDRILTSSMVDLGPDVRKIVAVLEEAYDILHDSARRDRYRRAIDTMG